METLKHVVRRYRLLTLAVAAIITYIILRVIELDTPALWVAFITVTLVILLTAIDMVRDIIRGHYGLDILAVVAMGATLSVGEYLASLIIVLMLTGGEALEDYAEYRASRELTSLLDRSPQVAHRISSDGTADGGSSIENIAVDEVRVGDVLLVRPSEIVPVDGVLLSPVASLDESSLTGESIPREIEEGQQVLSGSLNGVQAIQIQASKISAESEYQKIVSLVHEAQRSQAPVVRVADRFAIPFTIVSLLIAGIAWLVSGDPLRFAQVLVLATPCPLLIAAPVAFLGGLSRAANAGVVVKGGSVLEQLSRVRSVAFDKTGTLTQGHPELVELRPEAGFTEAELLRLSASAEQYSSHVLAEGILSAAKTHGVTLGTVTQASEEATNGVTATVDGHEVVIGKLAFVGRYASEVQETALSSGELAAYVSVNGAFAGAVVLADPIREDAASLIRWIRNRGVERVTMLSGDATETVQQVAHLVGIQETYAELLPEGKVQLMADLTPKPSLMVGDGVNDAPVLAAADIGIAMGARGATAASEAADAVLLRDRISTVADLIHISSHTMRVALQAIWIGIILSIGLMLVATTGVIPAVVGAFLQEIIDLVAIVYALRTLTGPKVQLPEAEESEQVYQRTGV